MGGAGGGGGLHHGGVGQPSSPLVPKSPHSPRTPRTPPNSHAGYPDHGLVMNGEDMSLDGQKKCGPGNNNCALM